MNSITNPFKVAIAQIDGGFLKLAETLETACEIIVDAGREGVGLVVFPEAFLPGYPHWIWSLPPDQDEVLSGFYVHLLENSVGIPSQITDKLCRVAQRARINVVIGVNERDEENGQATCYNTLLFIGSQGQILGKQRQMTLNGAERLIWTAGDGSTFNVFKLPFGKIGGLISGDSYMPLARYALYSWGMRLCLATSSQPTPNWIGSLRQIAIEGGIYVIGCGRALKYRDLPAEIRLAKLTPTEWVYGGGSVVFDPEGELVAGPYWQQQGIFYAELDLGKIAGTKRRLDITGQNSRPDIFELRVNRKARRPVQSKSLDWPDKQSEIE